jgi:hypothetical protein
MSGFIQSQNKNGIIPVFEDNLVDQVSKFPKPSLRTRCDFLLTSLVDLVGYSTTPVAVFTELKVQAETYSQDADAMTPLVEILEMEGLVKRFGDGVGLTPKGYLEVDGRTAQLSATAQGFVAMSFDKSLDSAFTDGFAQAIRDSGYRPLRIDGKEHANGISDEIMAEIRQSRFVVADYTLLNNGVYFEAGFALGSGITLIPTCNEKDFGKLHFDIRHINTLRWSTPTDLRSSLAKRISGILGKGPDVASL